MLFLNMFVILDSAVSISISVTSDLFEIKLDMTPIRNPSIPSAIP